MYNKIKIIKSYFIVFAVQIYQKFDLNWYKGECYDTDSPLYM